MKKITILDGSCGTLLWNMAEKNGLAKKPVWMYNTDAPQLVMDLADSYVKAGSEIIYSNTFAANHPSVEAEGYDLKTTIYQGIELAHMGRKKAVKDLVACGKMPEMATVTVALDVGPLTAALDPIGPVTEEECRRIYSEICATGKDAGASMIALETFLDINMMKIAAEEAVKTGLPVFCTMTFEKGTRTLFGNSVEEIVNALEPLGIAAIGLNCAYGPIEALPVIKEFAEKTKLPLILKPNTAGLGASEFAEAMKPALPLVSYIGACCGSDPSYIRALKRIAEEEAND